MALIVASQQLFEPNCRTSTPDEITNALCRYSDPSLPFASQPGQASRWYSSIRDTLSTAKTSVTIKPADQQKLDALFSEYRQTYHGRREDYFALLYLTRKFGLTVEQVAHQVAFGGNDYGVDAFHVDRSSRNLYLYQFKWSEDASQFKGSMNRLLKDGLQRIFGATDQDRDQNDLLLYLKREMQEVKHAIEGVYMHFVFKGDPDGIEKSEGLIQRREELEGKAHLVWQHFNRQVGFQTDFIADRPGRKGPPRRQVFDVRFERTGEHVHDDRTLHVGFMPLADLQSIHASLGHYFFDRNIRASLPDDNTSNRKLREAFDRILLKEEDEPSVFAFRHNGVTLAAERVEVGDGGVTLHVPRLLNGAQTVSSLTRFLESNSANAALKRNKGRLEQIRVLAKVVEADPASDFVTHVTISNNQQSPVHPWALRAMDQRQVDLADKFREEVQIYYSRQEGAFDSLSDEELEELGISPGKDIRIKPLAQTFLAVQGDVTNMRQLPDVFESQKLYDSTFKASYLNVDARAIVLGYKVGQMLPRVMGALRDAAPERFKPAVTASKNLTWALLIQGVLNERNYGSLLDLYGLDLIKQTDFGTLLKRLAITRVLPLIRALCNMSSYQQKASNGRFDFLRNTEAYRRAMDEARDKFDWAKRSF